MGRNKPITTNSSNIISNKSLPDTSSSLDVPHKKEKKREERGKRKEFGKEPIAPPTVAPRPNEPHTALILRFFIRNIAISMN